MESSSAKVFVVERFEDDAIRVTIPPIAAIVTAMALHEHSRMSCRVLGALAACITESMVDEHVESKMKFDVMRVKALYSDKRHTPQDNPFRVAKNGLIFGPIHPMEFCSIASDADHALEAMPPMDEESSTVAGTLGTWVRGRSRFTTAAEQMAAAMSDDIVDG